MRATEPLIGISTDGMRRPRDDSLPSLQGDTSLAGNTGACERLGQGRKPIERLQSMGFQAELREWEQLLRIHE
jgi:hypothetical protein